MTSRVNRSGDISIWEVPEIDGVRRSLEWGTMDDEASDRWFRLIDYATDPSPITEDRHRRMQQIANWFVAEDRYMQTTLEIGSELHNTPDLVELYRSTLDQIAEITGIDTQVPVKV